MAEEYTNGKLEEIKVDEENEVIVKGAEKINDSSSSSSSSSDDKSIEKISINLEKLEDENEGFVSEPKSVEPTDTISEELIQDEEVLAETKEESAPCLDENIESSPTTVEVVSEETVEMLLPENGNTGELTDIVDLASKQNLDTELGLDENIQFSSEVVDLKSGENVLKKLEDVPADETDTTVVVERNIEDQPIGSLAPSIGQRASWMSCCGLADFMRRSR